jgi:N-acetylglucosaminyl-diphospho-decaprenol L-rhamnosyltransferase
MSGIAVVVVSFNTREVLRACLESLRAAEVLEIVVVDNGSTDGSVEMVRRDFPRVRLVEAANRGYGAAGNLGFRATTSEYVLLLNSDTVVEEGGIEALGEYLDQQPRAAVVGPRLRNPDGSLQPSCSAFLGTFRLTLEKSPLGKLLAHLPWIRNNVLLLWSPHDRARRVPWVLGAALAVRRSAFEAIGGFDESYFMYAEEADLCYRLRREGWETHFAPVTDIVHLGGASTAPLGPEMEVQRIVSAVRFYRRHYHRAHRELLVVMIKAAAVLRLLSAHVRRVASLQSDRVRIREQAAARRHIYEALRRL